MADYKSENLIKIITRDNVEHYYSRIALISKFDLFGIGNEKEVILDLDSACLNSILRYTDTLEVPTTSSEWITLLQGAIYLQIKGYFNAYLEIEIGKYFQTNNIPIYYHPYSFADCIIKLQNNNYISLEEGKKLYSLYGYAGPLDGDCVKSFLNPPNSHKNYPQGLLSPQIIPSSPIIFSGEIPECIKKNISPPYSNKENQG